MLKNDYNRYQRMRMRVSDYIGNYEHTRAYKQLSLCACVSVCVYRHIGASHVTKFQVQARQAASQKNDESKHRLPPPTLQLGSRHAYLMRPRANTCVTYTPRTGDIGITQLKTQTKHKTRTKNREKAEANSCQGQLQPGAIKYVYVYVCVV